MTRGVSDFATSTSLPEWGYEHVEATGVDYEHEGLRTLCRAASSR